MPELAIRLDRKAGDLEREQVERSAILARLASDGAIDLATVRAAITSYRSAAAAAADAHVH